MRRKESEQIRFTVQWKTLDFGDSVTFFHKTFQKGEIQVIEILIQLFGCLLPNFSEKNMYCFQRGSGPVPMNEVLNRAHLNNRRH